MPVIQSSDLIINENGSIYHLDLKPGDLAETIITVGDPNRVVMVSQNFDEIIFKKQKREFVTHTGLLNNKKISVCSTGMGTDNIDIFINEVDALFNIDFDSRQVKDNITQLTFIRIGTSGSIQANIPLDSILISEYAIGFDTLMQFYKFEGEGTLQQQIDKYLKGVGLTLPFYSSKANEDLLVKFSSIGRLGITITNPGFYGPQSRGLRASIQHPSLNEILRHFKWNKQQISNLEMETAGIYSLATLLGHNAISLNAILANRATGQFSKQASTTVKRLIEKTLEIIANESI